MRKAVDQLGVDLVGDHEQVVLDRQPGHEFHVFSREHAAGRVLGRVHDDQAGPRSHQSRQFVEVQAEVAVLAQADAHRHRADEVHERRVDGVAGVGQDHLVAAFDTGQQRE